MIGMKKQNTILLLAIFGLLISSFASGADECDPRQVRILLGDAYTQYNQTQDVKANTATIIYQTYGSCEESSIKVVINNQEVIYNGKEGHREITHSKWNGEQFCHNGKSCESLVYDQFVHVYRIPIQTGISFTYKIQGGPKSMSKSFKSILPAIGKEVNKKQRIIFFGDQDETLQGKLNFKRFADLKEKGDKNSADKIDSLIFLGDYGYEYYQKNGKVGDSYLDRIEEFIAEWPTIFSPGNHEDQYNFKFFNEKFQNPSFSSTKNNYFSFNQGLIHFIGVNLHYFSHWANESDKAKMLNWLEQDLIKANENRQQTPWVIAFGHKAINCVQNDECFSFPKIYRQIDDLFYNYHVDLYLGAHVHYQEYIKPMYRESIQKYEGDEKLIRFPQGMITVIQGNGGKANEFIEHFKQNIKYTDKMHPNSFEVNYHVGYGILEVHDERILCIKNINSYLNTVSGHHCIESKHKFNPDLMNTQILTYVADNSVGIRNMIAVGLSIIVSSGLAYYLLKNKQQ